MLAKPVLAAAVGLLALCAPVRAQQPAADDDPVVAIVDSNSAPEGIAYPVPGNDDASRAINLYCDLLVGAVLDGIQAEMTASGADLGEIETLPEMLGDGGDGVEAEPDEAAAEPAANGDDQGREDEPPPAPTPSAEGVGVPGPDQPSPGRTRFMLMALLRTSRTRRLTTLG